MSRYFAKSKGKTLMWMISPAITFSDDAKPMSAQREGCTLSSRAPVRRWKCTWAVPRSPHCKPED